MIRYDEEFFIDEVKSPYSNKRNNKKFLYINALYGKLKRKGFRIVFYKDDKLIASFPSKKIDNIIILGNISFTPQLLNLLLQNNISISFLDRNGRFRGRLENKFSKNSILRYKQMKIALSDEKKRFEISKFICKTKLKILIDNIKRRIKEKKLSKEHYKECSQIYDLIKNITINPIAPEQLLGIEGTAARIYYSIFHNFILEKDFKFFNRTKRPPQDEVNAMLSFGYTLLVTDFISLIYSIGMDPYIGFYHKLRYGNPALALDLVEPFRAFFIDNMVLFMINNKMIKLNHFEKRDGGVFLNKEGRDIFLAFYNDRKNRVTKYKYKNIHLRYNHLFNIYLYRIANFILERSNELIFFSD